MIVLRLRELIARWETEHQRRLNYEELANLTGVGAATVNRWANNDVEMRVLDAFCEFFGVQPGELLSCRPTELISESDADRATREARERGLGIADLIEAPAR